MGTWDSADWSAKAEPVPYAKLDDPQTLNLYAYVRNNPISLVDPDGHWIRPDGSWSPELFFPDDDSSSNMGSNELKKAKAQQQNDNNSSTSTTGQDQSHFVSVSYWPKGAGGFGHIGIGVDSDDTQGYSTKDPKTSIWKRIFGAPAGTPEDDIKAHTKNDEVVPHSYLHIAITADQAAAMQGAIAQRYANGGHYNLLFNNCAQFVETVLHAGGVSGVPHAEVFGPAILEGALWYGNTWR